MSLLMPPGVELAGPLFGRALLAAPLPLAAPAPPPVCPTSSFSAALKRSKLVATDSASALTFSPAPRMILAACSGFSATFFVCSTCTGAARVYRVSEVLTYYFRGDGFGGRLVVRRVKKSKSRRALSDKKLYRCVLHANTDGCIYTDKRESGAGASLRGAYGTVANVSLGTVAGWHVRKVLCMPSEPYSSVQAGVREEVLTRGRTHTSRQDR